MWTLLGFKARLREQQACFVLPRSFRKAKLFSSKLMRTSLGKRVGDAFVYE